MILQKIISGGQTGVDQAALEVAIHLGMDHGGWCPPDRICESGTIPSQFNLKETPEERMQMLQKYQGHSGPSGMSGIQMPL